MFYYLNGVVAALEANLAVIDCGGVGFACNTTAYTMSQLQIGKSYKLYTYCNVKEDAFDIFGFSSKEELNCFNRLLSVSGVGPKAAMSILSAGPQNFTLAVMTGDEKLLTAAQGIGKKTAQRIILELKDKIGGSSMEIDFSTGPVVATPQSSGSVAMARAALQELGYSPAEIQTALKGADPNATTEELVRHALRAMVMKG
jgi:Holliday junction DNA helicase RuvA